MIRKFNDFLNEAKKPALYKKGDIVRVVFDATGSVVDYGNDTAYNNRAGMIVEITNIFEKGGKWLYETELLYGAFQDCPKRGASRTSTYHLTKWFEKDLTTEGVNKFLDAIKKSKYKINDIISLSKDTKLVSFYKNSNDFKTSKTITTKIVAVCVEPLIESDSFYYIVQNPSDPWQCLNGIVSEKDIFIPEKINDDSLIFIAKEIASTIGCELEDDEKQKTVKFKTKHLVSVAGNTFSMFNSHGYIYFKNNELRNEFLKDLSKLFSKYSDLDKLQRNRKPEVTQGKEFYNGMEDSIELKYSEIINAAKDMKIDIEAVLHKNRSKIHGKNFGI